MIRVNNIKQNGRLITFDYYPELKDSKGTAVYDIELNKIVKEILVSDYDPYDRGLALALRVLRRWVLPQKDKEILVFKDEYLGYIS